MVSTMTESNTIYAIREAAIETVDIMFRLLEQLCAIEQDFTFIAKTQRAGLELLT